MKVELSIADDRELRAHIRDVIKGEVTSIARGEIRTLIAEAVDKKIIPSRQEDVDQIVRSVIRDMVKSALEERTYSYTGDWIRSEARTIIREVLVELIQQGRVP